MKFHVTYPNGKKAEVEASDCESVEAFCNSHFGSSWEEAKEHGAKVVIADGKAVESDSTEEAPGTSADEEPKGVVAKVTAAVKKAVTPAKKATKAKK